MESPQNNTPPNKRPVCRGKNGATSTPKRCQRKENKFLDPLDITDEQMANEADKTFRREFEDSKSVSNVSVCGGSNSSTLSLPYGSNRKRSKKFTTVQPFTFESRDNQKLLQKLEKSKEVPKKEEIPKFRARPMPKYLLKRKASLLLEKKQQE